MLYYLCLSLFEERGSPARFNFLELATGGGPFYFYKGGLTCCQGGGHFDLPWGRFYAIQTVLSLCRGLSARFRFLELATGGGRFYFSKWGLTCCQRGGHFDLLWGRAINPSKTYLFTHCFSAISRCFLCYIICV